VGESRENRSGSDRRGDGWLGREADFSTLYRRHAEGVLGFFSRRTSEPQAALDLTAETFAQAFAGRRRAIAPFLLAHFACFGRSPQILPPRIPGSRRQARSVGM
jgi:hypothetical protein